MARKVSGGVGEAAVRHSGERDEEELRRLEVLQPALQLRVVEAVVEVRRAAAKRRREGGRPERRGWVSPEAPAQGRGAGGAGAG